MKTIVLFGSSRPQPDSEDYQKAYDLGYALARAGYRLANGGYGGIMEASAKGAKDAGGATVGVTCEAFGRKGPNSWIDREIRTQTLQERLTRLIELGDAWLALRGGTGTLLELAMVWELVHKGFLPQKPILCVTDYWKPLVKLMAGSGEKAEEYIYFAQSPQDVMDRLRHDEIIQTKQD